MGLRFERSHSPFLLRPVCFICRGRYDLAVSADSRCKRCRKGATGRRQRARYYARPLSATPSAPRPLLGFLLPLLLRRSGGQRAPLDRLGTHY